MKVVCLKHGALYGPEWVINLKRMVGRNLPIPHEFVCLTDKPIPDVDCIQLDTAYTGWWTKLELFKPGRFTDDTLYLDLDVVITDSLLPLVALLYKSPGLWARDDFSYSMRNPKRGLDEDFKRLLGGDGCINSSVMLWRGDVASDVWTKLEPWMLTARHGDQNIISDILRGRIQFIPDEMVCSYKYHIVRGAPVAPIVVFHGRPKVDSLHRRDPLRVAWES